MDMTINETSGTYWGEYKSEEGRMEQIGIIEKRQPAWEKGKARGSVSLFLLKTRCVPPEQTARLLGRKGGETGKSGRRLFSDGERKKRMRGV